MRRALILGGTGPVGRAVARRLLAAGWRVDLTGRDPAGMPGALAADGARFTAADRRDPAALAAVLGPGADLLVDCLCHTAADARLLLPLLPDTPCAVMVSARAVYADAAGRHLNSAEPPRFDGPIGETHPVTAPGTGEPGSREGYGPHKAAAERVLLDSGAPVTVVRPSRIHGEGAAPPRSWYFVRRALDRRPAVLLREGAGGTQMTAAATLAALVEAVAAAPAARVLNCADAEPVDALTAARAVAARLGHAWDEITVGDEAPEPLGRSPFDSGYRMTLDTSAAEALTHAAAGSWEATAADEIDWLVDAVRGGPRAGVLPAEDDPFFAGLFDYAAEDRHLASRV